MAAVCSQVAVHRLPTIAESMRNLSDIYYDHMGEVDALSVAIQEWIVKSSVFAGERSLESLEHVKDPAILSAIKEKLIDLKVNILVEGLFGKPLTSNQVFIDPREAVFPQKSLIWDKRHLTLYLNYEDRDPLDLEPAYSNVCKLHVFATKMLEWVNLLPPEIYPFSADYRAFEQMEMPETPPELEETCWTLYRTIIQGLNLAKIIEDGARENEEFLRKMSEERALFEEKIRETLRQTEERRAEELKEKEKIANEMRAKVATLQGMLAEVQQTKTTEQRSQAELHTRHERELQQLQEQAKQVSIEAERLKTISQDLRHQLAVERARLAAMEKDRDRSLCVIQ